MKSKSNLFRLLLKSHTDDNNNIYEKILAAKPGVQKKGEYKRIIGEIGVVKS